MFSLQYGLILAAVTVIAIGQILFKLAAKEISVPSNASYIDILYTNIFPLFLVASAVTLYMMSTLAWVYALRTVPLSIAFMFNALAFILVPVGAFWLFNESMPKYFLLGLAMIVGGIFLISRG